MKRFPLVLVLLAASLWAGCDRGLPTDIETITPPELHVFVEDAEGARVQGATVTLYDNEDDFTDGTNPVFTGQTGADGRVVVTAAELQEPGIFHVRATADALEGSRATPYLLLTDGITYLEVVLQPVEAAAP